MKNFNLRELNAFARKPYQSALPVGKERRSHSTVTAKGLAVDWLYLGIGAEGTGCEGNRRREAAVWVPLEINGCVNLSLTEHRQDERIELNRKVSLSFSRPRRCGPFSCAAAFFLKQENSPHLRCLEELEHEKADDVGERRWMRATFTLQRVPHPRLRCLQINEVSITQTERSAHIGDAAVPKDS